MPGTADIPNHFKTEFATNWEHLSQQTESRLKPYVTMENFSGERKSFNQMGARTMQRQTERNADTYINSQPMQKRWIYREAFTDGDLLDEHDAAQLGDIILPDSDIMKAMQMAYDRQCDQTILDALGGTAYSGKLGTTPNTFDTANQRIAVNYKGPGVTPANVGMNLAKLIAAKSKFGRNEVMAPGDELICIINQQALDDMLFNIDQVNSADYNNAKALVEGMVDRFMGMKFIRSELIPVNTSTDISSVYVYNKRLLKFSGGDKRAYINERADKSNATQLRVSGLVGAVRMEEVGVVEILCDQSP